MYLGFVCVCVCLCIRWRLGVGRSESHQHFTTTTVTVNSLLPSSLSLSHKLFVFCILLCNISGFHFYFVMFWFLVSFLSKPFRPVHVYYYDDHHYNCFVLLSFDLCIFHGGMNKAQKLGFIQGFVQKRFHGNISLPKFSSVFGETLYATVCLSKMLTVNTLLCHGPCLTVASKHIFDNAVHCIMPLNRCP